MSTTFYKLYKVCINCKQDYLISINYFMKHFWYMSCQYLQSIHSLFIIIACAPKHLKSFPIL